MINTTSRLVTVFAAALVFTCPQGFAVAQAKPQPAESAAVQDTASLKLPAALAAAGFAKFAAMIDAAGLTETIGADGPFTCFAPTDEALVAMPDERKRQLESDPKSDETVAWIKYHFVRGLALKHEDLMKIPGANGFSDHYLRVWVTPGKIAINRVCELTRFDIAAANGVIHESSRVLESGDETRVFHKDRR
jgi:uncharacterized surface protein with fasciclin (FAS1) repeats